MTEIFFADNNTLWETDGTAAGTQQVSSQTVTNPQFFNVGGRVVFESAAFFSYLGHTQIPDEIWVTDGTAPGTQRLAADLYQFGGSAPVVGIGNSTAVVNGTLYFSASDHGTHGVELWQSDGTSAGTHMVKDIASHYADSSNPAGLTSFNGALYFVANDRTVGTELWRSDGTSAGTQPFTDATGTAFINAFGPTVFNGALFFDASNRNGAGLWKTDGTAAGTQLVLGGTGFGAPVIANDRLFFTDGTRDLWASDGTSAGTQPIAAAALFAGGGPANLTAAGNELFFTAADGTHGMQLWESDGTVAGTQELTLANTTSRSGLNPGNFTAAGSKLFFTGTDGSSGTQLWVSDGTSAGTQELTSLFQDGPRYLTNVNGTLFFADEDANQSHGWQIWASDGTAAGTHVVTDFPANINYPSRFHLSAVGNQLFFDASDGSGEHAFMTDGTTVTQLTTGSADNAASTFFAVPIPTPHIVIPPGSAVGSFDTRQDMILDLSQADQPHQFALSGNDTIVGGTSASTIFGTAGNDLVNLSAGATGSMWFIGQAGNDTMDAAAGTNSLTGGSGTDVFNVIGGSQWITTGSGNSAINISGGQDTVLATQGTSTMSVGNAGLLLGVFGGSHQVSLTDGAPVVLTLGGTSTISASGATTPLVGVFGGNDTINMGDGNETLFGVGGNATINGAAGIAQIDLVSGSLQVNAGSGITELFVNGGDNTLLLQSNGGPTLISFFDPAHLHIDIASHINGNTFTDLSQIPASHLPDGSLLLDLGTGSHGEEQVQLVGVSSIPSSAISFV